MLKKILVLLSLKWVLWMTSPGKFFLDVEEREREREKVKERERQK